MNTNLPQLDRRIQVIVVKVPLCSVSRVDDRLNLYFNYPEKGSGKNEKTHDIRLALPSERVVRALNQIISWRGKPMAIRVDNSPEYISATLQNKAERAGITRHLQT